MRSFGDLEEVLVGLAVIALAHKSHRSLHAVGEAVGFIMGEADGLVVFDAGLFLIAHESIGVAEAKLRGDEVRINLERGTIVSE